MSRILVAMSGGVDSSVACTLLMDQGHEVSGCTLDLFDESVSGSAQPCPATKAIADSQKVAQRLGIEHRVLRIHEVFRQRVIDNFIQTYLDGDTPNPCVQCNRHIKFGALIDEAVRLGFDSIATGHYARVRKDERTGRYLLQKAIDPAKDQSYVLYSLQQDQLARAVFPLGGMSKAEVRSIAAREGFESAHTGESQDICFLPDGDYAGFLERERPEAITEGNYLDVQGSIIGRHRGVSRYTIGQRRGIAIALGYPAYVIDKNAHDNTVTLGESAYLFASALFARDVSFIPFEHLEGPLRCTARIRYNQGEQPATIYPCESDMVRVVFDEPQRAIASGQSVVFFDGDLVVGGGIIAGIDRSSLTRPTP